MQPTGQFTWVPHLSLGSPIYETFSQKKTYLGYAKIWFALPTKLRFSRMGGGGGGGGGGPTKSIISKLLVNRDYKTWYQTDLLSLGQISKSSNLHIHENLWKIQNVRRNRKKRPIYLLILTPSLHCCFCYIISDCI